MTCLTALASLPVQLLPPTERSDIEFGVGRAAVRELKALRELSHPNIIPVRATGDVPLGMGKGLTADAHTVA